jgi:hypothetical protein
VLDQDEQGLAAVPETDLEQQVGLGLYEAPVAEAAGTESQRAPVQGTCLVFWQQMAQEWPRPAQVEEGVAEERVVRPLARCDCLPIAPSVAGKCSLVTG